MPEAPCGLAGAADALYMRPMQALHTVAPPRCIALDWGTSNLRASLLGDGGSVLASRSAPGGVMAIVERRFEAALMALAGDWIAAHRCPLVASGMVGSRQGWQEAPYLPCPAALEAAALQLTAVALAAGPTLHIAPGLRCQGSDGQFDVMRGEETQLWGAGLAPGACCLLPGTHSKWAWMGDRPDEVRAFRTYLTGELYAVLSQHSILGRGMEFDAAVPEAFEASESYLEGVRLGLAEHAQATHVIFAARTAGLMNRYPPAALPDFLSGLLIGIEIGSATRDGAPEVVTVLGDAALAERYEVALREAGLVTTRAAADATTRGQWRLAQAAGLVGSGA